MANLFGRLVKGKEARDFLLKFNDSSHAFLAQRCSNRNGCYVVLAKFGERRQRRAVMIPQGQSNAGWQAFLQMCEELISVIGVLRHKKLGHGNSQIKQGVSFAQMVRAGSPERKVMGEKESHMFYVVDGSLKNQSKFGVPKASHAVIGEDHVPSKKNHFVEVPAVMAGSGGRLWDHLMKIKAKLDGLIELAKKKEVELEPNKAFCCLICGFSLVFQ